MPAWLHTERRASRTPQMRLDTRHSLRSQLSVSLPARSEAVMTVLVATSSCFFFGLSSAHLPGSRLTPSHPRAQPQQHLSYCRLHELVLTLVAVLSTKGWRLQTRGRWGKQGRVPRVGVGLQWLVQGFKVLNQEAILGAGCLLAFSAGSGESSLTAWPPWSVPAHGPHSLFPGSTLLGPKCLPPGSSLVHPGVSVMPPTAGPVGGVGSCTCSSVMAPCAQPALLPATVVWGRR